MQFVEVPGLFLCTDLALTSQLVGTQTQNKAPKTIKYVFVIPREFIPNIVYSQASAIHIVSLIQPCTRR